MHLVLCSQVQAIVPPLNVIVCSNGLAVNTPLFWGEPFIFDPLSLDIGR